MKDISLYIRDVKAFLLFFSKMFKYMLDIYTKRSIIIGVIGKKKRGKKIWKRESALKIRI